MSERAIGVPRRAGLTAALLCMMPYVLSACAEPRPVPLSEPEKVVRAALRLLTSARATTCVDNRTTGKPLAIFATMAVAPQPSRRPLAWRAVASFEDGTKLTNIELYHDTFAGGRSLLVEPRSASAALPLFAQSRLNAAALALARSDQSSRVDLRDGLGVAGITAWWWPWIRMSPQCDRQFTLSDPVVAKDIGYITIHGEHRGVTYALQPRGGDWVAVAEWNTWLF